VANPGARGLGRGLVAMLDPSTAAQPFVQLPVDRVDPNPRQPRRSIDAEALAALTRSIAADGVVQPVVVRERADGRYELIAGERRWRAAMAAGLTTVPAVVRNAPDRDALLLAIVENVVREDLNPVEVARGYAALADGYGLTVLEIAERVGRSRSAVSNVLRLLELPDDVLELIGDGRLSEGHGRAILQVDDADGRRALARRAAAAGLSVRQTEALARRAGGGRKRAPVAQAWVDDEAIGEVVDAAYRAFGVPARVTPVRGGCRVELVVRSEAELTALAGRLGEVAELVETHIVR
jgi:ParB family transcriptional regulator, chromosome partitioning protein